MNLQLNINREIYSSWVLILFLGLSFQVYSQTSKFENIKILKETTKKFSIDQVINDNLSFQDYTPQFGLTKEGNYWLRFTYIKNDSNKVYYLLRPFLLDQKLDLYYKINGKLQHFENGIGLPFKQRYFFLPNLYLPLPNTPDTTVCYLHIKSFFYYSFFFAERDTQTLVKEEYQRASTEYFFIGLGFLSILFSLIFFAFLKERLYLYYSVFTLMLVMLRLTVSGVLFNYINSFYDLTELESIFNLYAFTYAGINIALLLYFHEYFRFYQRSKLYHRTFYGIIAFRVLILLVNDYLPNNFNVYSDLAIQCFLFLLSIRTANTYLKQSIPTILSLAMLILGNILLLFPNIISPNYDGAHYIYLNLAGLEVITFAIGTAYRSNFLKKEKEHAIANQIVALQESEALKEGINRELEKQVAERTQQIQEMNEVLKRHNIELSTEVKHANEARAFQKRMSFADFQKIFIDDEFCFKYLAQLKWKPNEVIKCRKCGYEKHAVLPNHAIRCGKCSYIESVTFGTLFQKLKFSILKAFYIAYLTSTSKNSSEATIAELSKEIDLRPATLWTFKQKVLALMEANKTRKKHKDGWTHLIEYSITK